MTGNDQQRYLFVLEDDFLNSAGLAIELAGARAEIGRPIPNRT
jgi:hypothetical protein